MTTYKHEKHYLKDIGHMYYFEISDGNSRQVTLYPHNDLVGDDFCLLSGQIFSNKMINEQPSFPIGELESILEKYDAKILYFENLEKF